MNKTRLLHVPRKGWSGGKNTIVLEASGRKWKIGSKRRKFTLIDHRGFLQGVFETPDGKILQLRFHPEYKEYTIYVGNTWDVVGYLALGLEYRKIRPIFTGIGLGTELFDLREKSLATKFGEKHGNKFRTTVKISTSKADTAAFLAKRGYTSTNPSTRQKASDLAEHQQNYGEELPESISLEKAVEGTPYDNNEKWHRIKVIGRNKRQIKLTLRAIPLEKVIK